MFGEEGLRPKISVLKLKNVFLPLTLWMSKARRLPTSTYFDPLLEFSLGFVMFVLLKNVVLCKNIEGRNNILGCSVNIPANYIFFI